MKGMGGLHYAVAYNSSDGAASVWVDGVIGFFVSASTRGRFISLLRTHIYLILQEDAHYALKREKKCYESGIWLYGPLLPSYSANYCNSISGDGPSSTEEF